MGIQNYSQEKNLIIEERKFKCNYFQTTNNYRRGRLGILSVVFDFIKDNKKLFLVGNGGNKYQFVYGDDLASACILASQYNKTNIFNIGSPNPCTLYETFDFLIKKASSKSKIYSLPASIILPLEVFL